MAETLEKEPAKKVATKKPVQKFVTVSQFKSLENSVGQLVDLIKSGALTASATPAAVAEEKAVAAAAPNKYQVNTEWEALAREILGDKLDHTEIAYLKGGGQTFTIVVASEHSNAPKDYLERYKVDRRSREVGSEGEAGVKTWCEQVKRNLDRPRTN